MSCGNSRPTECWAASVLACSGRSPWARRGPVTEIHGHIADRVSWEPTVRATARFHALRRTGIACACVEGVFDPLADDIFLAVDAVQVDLVQDAGAVASPCGDLCGRVSRVATRTTLHAAAAWTCRCRRSSYSPSVLTACTPAALVRHSGAAGQSSRPIHPSLARLPA